jgi:hypothetical protein
MWHGQRKLPGMATDTLCHMLQQLQARLMCRIKEWPADVHACLWKRGPLRLR